MKYISNDIERLKTFRELMLGTGIVKRCSDIHDRDDIHIFIAYGEKNDEKLQKLLKKFNRIIHVVRD